jgi:putative membrane protein
MKKKKKQKAQLSRTDALAIERTRLANERTFLAYFRTFIVFLSSGFAILKMEVLQEIRDIGYFLTFLAPLLLIVGVVRFFYVKRQVRKYYYPIDLIDPKKRE